MRATTTPPATLIIATARACLAIARGLDALLGRTKK